MVIVVLGSSAGLAYSFRAELVKAFHDIIVGEY
jgi:hypothetical protein